MFFDPKLFLYYIQPYLSIIKKILIVGVTLFIILKLFAYFTMPVQTRARVQDPVQNDRDKFYAMTHDPELEKDSTKKVEMAVVQVTMCNIFGEGCTDNKKDTNFRNSIAGGLTSMIVLPLSSPVASYREWARTGLENAGLVPHSQAAVGVGLAAIAPFKDLWMIFRNFAFLIMVIVMVVIGFMIMFRSKINAQTVISLENALPKIVIAMILITFSYAIAGLMIDLMYISMGLIIQLFSANASAPYKAQDIINLVFFGTSWDAITSLFIRNFDTSQVSQAMYDFIPDVVRTILESLVSLFSFKAMFYLAGAIVGMPSGQNSNASKYLKGVGKDILSFKSFTSKASLITKVVDGVETQPAIGAVARIVITLVELITPILFAPMILKGILVLILWLSLFFVMFKIFFMFLSSYIQIMLLVIFSPFILITEMVPGKSAFGTWIKSLFINLLTFPLFLVLILLARAIMTTYSTQAQAIQFTGQSIFVPAHTAPLWGPPFLWGMNSEAFSAIIGASLLFMAPDLIKSFKEMTGIKPMTQMNLKFSSFFAGATGLVGGAMGVAGQYHSIAGMFLGPTAAHEGFKKFGPVKWFQKRAEKADGPSAEIPPGASEIRPGNG